MNKDYRRVLEEKCEDVFRYVDTYEELFQLSARLLVPKSSCAKHVLATLQSDLDHLMANFDAKFQEAMSENSFSLADMYVSGVMIDLEPIFRAAGQALLAGGNK